MQLNRFKGFVRKPLASYTFLVFPFIFINFLDASLSRRIPEWEDENRFVLEDDMEFLNGDTDRSALSDARYEWPNGLVLYYLHKSVYENEEILKRVHGSQSEISSKTCILFGPASEMADYWVTYFLDPNATQCSATVAFQGIPNQRIKISPTCTEGELVHVTLHTLGFFHEHTRDDRDDFVKINNDNIQDDARDNFVKDAEKSMGDETNYYGVAYNYESIMHYGPYAFSADNNTKTIISANNKQGLGNADQMGQRGKLSDGDIQMINKKYCEKKEEGPSNYIPPEASTSTNRPEVTSRGTVAPQISTTKGSEKPHPGKPPCLLKPFCS